jgi:hypothetical protein
VISATSDPLNIISSGIALPIYDNPRCHRLQQRWNDPPFRARGPRSTEVGVGLALAEEKP